MWEAGETGVVGLGDGGESNVGLEWYLFDVRRYGTRVILICERAIYYRQNKGKSDAKISYKCFNPFQPCAKGALRSQSVLAGQ